MKLNWKTNKYCTVDVCQKHLEGGGLRRVEDFKYSLYTSIPHSNELEHSQEHFFFFLDGSTFSLCCIPYIGYLLTVLAINLHVT